MHKHLNGKLCLTDIANTNCSDYLDKVDAIDFLETYDITLE